jgi:hypothetical protein
MFASRMFKPGQTALVGAVVLLGAASAAWAEDVTFSLSCSGAAHHQNALADSFDTGILCHDIARGSDTRAWTPTGDFTEQDWKDDIEGTWHSVISGPEDDLMIATSKSRAGLQGAGNVIVLDPRVNLVASQNPIAGHAFAHAGMGDVIQIPRPPDPDDPGGHLFIGGGMIATLGSQWIATATPTEIDVPLPIDTPFQLDLVAMTVVLFPENVAQVLVEVLVDGEPVVSGFAELSSGGMLFQGGDLEGVFLPPEYEPGSGELFGRLEIELTLAEGWYIVSDSCPGDLDGDRDADLADLAQLLAGYGTSDGASYEDGDLDGDGDVDLFDLAELLAHYGEVCP